MDDIRKKAYITLNYQALLDIKNSGNFSEENYKKVFRIAHAFHNLAYFITQDFEGFDEDDFWKTIQSLETQFGCTHYREIFDKLILQKQ